MLKLVSARERGLNNPQLLRQTESTRRAINLELSRHRDIERVHSGSINSLDIDSVEDRYLLSGGADGYIAIHDLVNSTGKVKYTCRTVCSIGASNRYRHKFSVETVQWYPLDTGLFISSGTDKLLKVWDTNKLKTADEYEFSGIVYSHHMSPVSTRHCLVAVGCQSASLKLVDLKSGSAAHTLRGHNKSVTAVRWSPKNEFLLASGSADNKMMLWDIRQAKSSLLVFDQYNGRPESSVKGDTAISAHSGIVNGLEFTKDGLHIVSFGTDNRIRLWNTDTGRNTMVNYGRIDNEGKRSVKFSMTEGCNPDLIFVPSRGNIDVYDMFNGSHIDTLRGHYSQVTCCVYQDCLQEMYSSGTDRNILAWLPAMVDYEEELTFKAKAKTKEPKFTQRIAATADTWSSDEDT